MSSDFEVITSCPTAERNHIGHHHEPTVQQWTSAVLLEQSTALIGRSPKRNCCSRCWTSSCSWLTSALGVTTLLVLYLMLGATMFMLLGNHAGTYLVVMSCCPFYSAPIYEMPSLPDQEAVSYDDGSHVGLRSGRPAPGEDNGNRGPFVGHHGGPQHPLPGQLDPFGPERDAPLPGGDRPHSQADDAGGALLLPALVDLPNVPPIRPHSHHDHR